MYYIYCIKNKKNQKKYIGLTSNVGDRVYQHINHSYNPNAGSYNTYFHRAIRKHGWQSFDVDIISTAETLEEANKLEVYYIDTYKTYSNVGVGYNLTIGGGGTKGLYRPPEVRERMAAAQRGKKKSVTALQNLHNSMLKFGEEIAKAWEITDPTGNTFPITNLRRFCINNNLDQGNMMKVVNGKISHCKGYKCKRLSD